MNASPSYLQIPLSSIPEPRYTLCTFAFRCSGFRQSKGWQRFYSGGIAVESGETNKLTQSDSRARSPHPERYRWPGNCTYNDQRGIRPYARHTSESWYQAVPVPDLPLALLPFRVTPFAKTAHLWDLFVSLPPPGRAPPGPGQFSSSPMPPRNPPGPGAAQNGTCPAG